ncbi:aminotransferase class III-fold pyridoxal phosphate-dependent enzyme [Candidatus Binatia bacterium]|nr:aminotransferase class III-fold pyridoxal phosphate-dependent enzyme [Candidatus Binatia bacterium]
MTEDKRRIFDLAERHVCPGRTRTFQGLGIDLVIGRREGYRIWDLDGRELLDFHLNGGVFNLGHRNPEVVESLRAAMDTLDIGNHHFPSVARAELAAELARLTPGDLQYTVFGSGGGEAVDLAIKSARHATRRRTIVSIHGGYHGHTGLALGAGDEKYANMFLSGGAPGDFVHVPFNDLDAMAAALATGDVAAVIIETIPATYGFPMPVEGYLSGVKDLCARYGSLYIADEVQTGLGRTGRLWGVECYGVEPDILVTSKGLSGGMYPIAATVLNSRAAAWLQEDGWAHVSTFGGAEIGCRVAQTVLEITTRPDTVDNVRAMSEYLGAGLHRIRERFPDWLVEIRQKGLIFGLRFAHPQGGMLMSKALYDSGLWAMFAGYDWSVLQFKAGLLIDRAFCDESLRRFTAGVERCRAGLT